MEAESTNHTKSDPNLVIIEVPLASGEVIVVPTNELPNASELLNLLPKQVDLKYWLRLATAYYAQDKIQDFEHLLNFALESINYQNTQHRQCLLSLLSFAAMRKIHSAEDASKSVMDSDPTSKESCDSDEARRKKLLDEAYMRLMEAERMEPGYQVLWIVRGALFLERENFEQAEMQFQNVLSRKKDSIPALAGMAIVFMRRNEWKAAIRFLQHTLRGIGTDKKYPLRVHSIVRISIGVCFARLGMVQNAKRAFERVIEIDPNNPNALVYLSSLFLNDMKKPNCSEDEKNDYSKNGVQFVYQAYRASQSASTPNPIVLARLADVLFIQGKTEKAHRAVTQAIPLTRDNSLLSELYYYYGRYFHFNGDMAAAQNYYGRSFSLNHDFLVARYAQAQICAWQGNKSTVIMYCEQVRAKHAPRGEDYDTLRMLSIFHAQMAEPPISESAMMPTKEYQEARQTSRRLYSIATELFKTLYALRSPDSTKRGDTDVEALAMYARVLETSPHATQETYSQALSLYLRMRDVLQEENKVVPLQLYNNIGVLYYITGDYENAKKYFHSTINEIKNNQNILYSERESAEISVMYNMARALEENMEITQAEAYHYAILSKMPQYYDSHLRLGQIAFERGMSKEASIIFERVTKNAPWSVEAHVLLGTLQLSLQQTREARKTFENIVSHIDRFDVVSLLHLGNIQLFARHDGEDGKQKKLAHAWRFFDKVLDLDPRNPYAANGIAMALREKGMNEQALRVFEQVREADDKSSCFTTNYARMLTEMNQPKRAIPMLERALEKYFFNKDQDLLQSTARAYYLVGRETKSSEMLRSSIKNLQRVLHIFPKDQTLLYNISVVMQWHTYVLSTERMDKITASEMQKAISLAQKAIDLFLWLSIHGSHLVDSDFAQQRATFTRSFKEKLGKRLDELINTHADRQKRLDEIIRSRNEEKERETEIQKQQLAEKNSQAPDDIDKRCRQFQEMIDSRMKLWNSSNKKPDGTVSELDEMLQETTAKGDLQFIEDENNARKRKRLYKSEKRDKARRNTSGEIEASMAEKDCSDSESASSMSNTIV